MGALAALLGRFFVTAAVVFVVLGLVSAPALRAAEDEPLDALAWALVAAALGLVGAFWVRAALVELVRDVRDGRVDRSVMETYAAVGPRLGAVIVAGLLAGIGIALGLLLLVVPGLILLTFWSMIVPATVLEDRPALRAFGRSREIVRGNGRPVLGLALLTLLISAIASLVIPAAVARCRSSSPTGSARCSPTA